MMTFSLTWYIFIPWKTPNPFITQGWEPPLSLVWYVSLFLFMVFLVSCQSLFKGCMWILIFPQNAEVVMIYVSLTCDVLAIRLLSVLEVFNDVFLVNLRRSFHEKHLNPFISRRLRISTFTWPWCFAFPSIFMSFLLGGGLVCWVQNLTGLFFALSLLSWWPVHYVCLKKLRLSIAR